MRNQLLQLSQGFRLKVLDPTHARFRRFCKRYGDEELIEDNEAMAVAMGQAMGLIELLEAQISALNTSLGEQELRHEEQLGNCCDIVLALIIHSGGEAIVSKSICDAVVLSNDKFEMDRLEDGAVRFTIASGDTVDECCNNQPFPSSGEIHE